jgi:hypothetical protein
MRGRRRRQAVANHEREHEKQPESPLENEGLRQYVAGIDPAAATEMEAVVEQLEAERDDFPPPDGRKREP